ncbi:MAG TPA: hypothetical protein VK694_03105 [Verrucomicrobiae bacterium]|nr:hypothetical protein [Verrucomicrobiae bacterium]
MKDVGTNTPSIFNSQRLLFDRAMPTPKTHTGTVTDDYYTHGWTVIDDIPNAQTALATQQAFIHSIDSGKVTLHARFQSRIRLAKADQIPVCDDIVATSFQVLHFDMGQPLVESNSQLLVTHVGIYLPKTTLHMVTARTRLVELSGLLEGLCLTPLEIENRIVRYVRKYGDGWANHNTLRLACFARFIDALHDTHELEKEIDKTVGQWFQTDKQLNEGSAYEQEQDFYKRHGVELTKVERQIALKPGQLLILDNTRVIHGRIGKRKTKELYNFMFGIESTMYDDIAALRRQIAELVA